MKGRILTIAGTDPSGGAGIQADIKTITSLRGYATSAITALVVQNTLGVEKILSIDEELVGEQMQCVINDIGVDAVKTGMLHTASLIEKICDVLSNYDYEFPLIVDPVMVAKSGDFLLEKDAFSVLKKKLIPKATIVTPNNYEAEILIGKKIVSDDDAINAGREILSFGAKSVLMKGGHRLGLKVRDILVSSEGIEIIESPRLDSSNTHGTGCTLSSAIATGIGQGMDLLTSVKRAHKYVHNALKFAPQLGKGNGPLNHVHNYTIKE